MTEETKEKIRQFNLGKKLTEEHKKKISENNAKYWLGKKRDTKYWLGKKRDDETKKKISMTNKSRPWSEARRKAQQFVFKKTIHKETLYSDDWIEIRFKIYERDHWTCQECGIKCHGNGTKDKIQCHHIDYNKNNYKLENLITLCASCHMKTNFNRGFWINKFNNGELSKQIMTT